jgi:hypothetical protein
MKKILIVLFCFSSIIINAQHDASVTFDSQTGNYIIEYMGWPNYGDEDYDGGKALIQLIFEPSTKIVPSVKSVVYFISDSNKFNYNYKVTNNANSTQRLAKFSVDYNSNISKIEKPNDDWHINFYSFVSVLRWLNSKGTGGISHPLNGISPDSSVTGFAFSSTGFPSISKAYFKGKPTIYLAYPDESNDTIQRKLRPLRKFPNNSVIRKTIGPRDLPVPFIHLEFIDTIITYSDSSFVLGWIKNEQTKNKYNNYFTTAKTNLEQGDSSAARNELEKVLTDCNTDSSSVLTSEAYALLYFNTEYLVNRVPEVSFPPNDIDAKVKAKVIKKK